jgi:CRISPR-associated endonuclease/helicase Cas3
MEPHSFQKRAHDFLREGKSVVLHAPTGAGKTRAALHTFFWAWEHDQPFPRQCIYSVPMRALANQFRAECGAWVGNLALCSPPSIALQTGERPEDPELKCDLVFTTIDQTLSNLLGVPYSVGVGRANLNAGAILGAYLVFDEFHLFPLGDPRKADGGLVTTLQLLRALKGLIPFTLMTATFSHTMLKELCVLLGAETVCVSPQELAAIPSQREKKRRFSIVEGPLTAQAVLERCDRRTIAVCNTVERAGDLYQGLIALGCRPIPFSGSQTLDEVYAAIQLQPHWETATWVMLLHSRFERVHRALKEELLLAEFGKSPSTRQIPSLVLVSTQVVEVGLDITSKTLHTEIAPANAVVQRAGRCARFVEEQGEVFIYDVPPSRDEGFRYAPYLGIEGDLCRLAWREFSERCGRNGVILDFHKEQVVVNEVHKEADRSLLDAMRSREGEIWRQISRSMGLQDVAQRQALIRRVDSRTVLVHDAPETLGNPYRCAGFSLWHGTLRGKWRDLEALKNERGLPWAMQFPVEVETGNGFRQEAVFRWQPVSSESDLDGHAVFVIHAALAAYDAEIGLRFAQAGGDYRSRSTWDIAHQRRELAYHLEDYLQHVRRMGQVYREELAHRLAYVAPRLERRIGAPRGSLEKGILLAVVLHDLAKMSEDWQHWARIYQEAIGEPVGDGSTMIVHTHLETEGHRRIERELQRSRPPHAGEGAVAATTVLHEALNGHHLLRRAVTSAIARHHSPRVVSFTSYRLHPAAVRTVEEALCAMDWSAKQASDLASRLRLVPPGTNLAHHLLRVPPEDSLDAWLAYFAIVRTLRLADGRSQEI